MRCLFGCLFRTPFLAGLDCAAPVPTPKGGLPNFRTGANWSLEAQVCASLRQSGPVTQSEYLCS